MAPFQGIKAQHGIYATIPSMGDMKVVAIAPFAHLATWECFVWGDWITAGAMKAADSFPLDFEYGMLQVPLAELTLSNKHVALSITIEQNTVDYFDNSRFGSTMPVGFPRVCVALNGNVLQHGQPFFALHRCPSLDDLPLETQYLNDTVHRYHAAGYEVNPKVSPVQWGMVGGDKYPLFHLRDTTPIKYSANDYEADYQRARYWLPYWTKQIERDASEWYRGKLLSQDAIEIKASEHLELHQYVDAIDRPVPMLPHTHDRVHRYLYDVFVAATGGALV